MSVREERQGPGARASALASRTESASPIPVTRSVKKAQIIGLGLACHPDRFDGSVPFGPVVAETAGTAFTFLAVHQRLFGVHLGSVFAPDHKGRPIPPRQ